MAGKFYSFTCKIKEAAMYPLPDAKQVAEQLRANMDANGYPATVTGPITLHCSSGGMEKGVRF